MHLTSSPAIWYAARASGDLHADVDGPALYELVLAISWATDRFHDDQEAGRHQVRWAFCKDTAVIEEGIRRLRSADLHA